jgi:hypothetical protein
VGGDLIELYLLKPTQMLEIPTESISWSGQRYDAARKIDARILYRKDTGREFVKIDEGDTVIFKWKGKELFRGTVFKSSRNKSGVLSFVAYDMLQYLLANKDVYVFSNKRADQIIKRIANDFEIPYAGIVNTGHVMKSQVFANETTLYDMSLKALIDTEKATNRKYYIYSKAGKLRLDEVVSHGSIWVLESGVNIEEYDYTTSIEDTATRVKLVAGEEDNPISATVTDSKGKSKFGILQYFEKITDDVNKAQLTNMANKKLAKKKGIQRTLNVDALGIPDLVSNMPVRVIEREIGVNKTYYVDSDNHTFQGNSHKMTLNLIENNHMPEGIS